MPGPPAEQLGGSAPPLLDPELLPPFVPDVPPLLDPEVPPNPELPLVPVLFEPPDPDEAPCAPDPEETPLFELPEPPSRPPSPWSAMSTRGEHPARIINAADTNRPGARSSKDVMGEFS